MTIGEFEDCVDGYKERMQEQMETQNILNHSLGAYIRTAFHDPKHYPKKASKIFNRTDTDAIGQDEQLDAYILAQIKKGN